MCSSESLIPTKQGALRCACGAPLPGCAEL